MRRGVALLLLSAACAASAPAGAQGGADGLTIRASRRDTVVASATVTAAFMVSNRAAREVLVVPRVEAPKDWTLLTGHAPFPLAQRGSELLMFSITVPARAAAGTYAVRAWVLSPGRDEVADSVLVRVPQRRVLDVGLIDRPGFVVAGKPYDARFLVRNRGNVASTLRLSVRSTRGTAAVRDSTLELAADESRVVQVHVQTAPGLEAAMDDVLELRVAEMRDTIAAFSSARITLVPEPSRSIEEYLRIPTLLRVRAASTDGVAPVELSGAGRIRDGGGPRLQFLLRAPTGAYSAYGERDEYSAELSAPSWRVRAGDHLFLLSSLTGTGQPGMGGSAEGTLGIVSAGGYAQQFRRLVEKGSESGSFLSARLTPDSRLGVNVVNRLGGFSPGRIGSASAALQRDSYGGDIEVATSRTPGGAIGTARNARLSAAVARGAYEIGHLFADTGFLGTQRGARHDFLTANQQASENLSFALSASTHRTDLTRSTGVPYLEHFSIATLGATLFNRYTTEVSAVTRGTTVQQVRSGGEQRSVRARGDHDLAFGALTVEIEGGRSREPSDTTGMRSYSELSLGLRRYLARGSGALWLGRYSGGSITKGRDGTFTVGGDMTMRVAPMTNVLVIGYATRVRTAIPQWHSQLDAQVIHALRNGNTISLRARLMSGGSLDPSDANLAYLEYALPVRVPVSRLRTPGRVHGRVVDATSGRGVAGALVRLGPQVGITDQRGQVAFGNVPAGTHRVAMSQETSFADAVFVGDPTLRIDSTRGQPTTFQLAIARSARVEIAVRRYSVARTAVASGADSLVDAGALADATIMLIGERDTLYRTTGDGGTSSFTDIPPGRWVVSLRGDAPAFMRFDPDRVELTLAPGETRALTFRLVPRKREVQIIGAGEELRPTAAEPKPPPKPRP